MDEADAYLLQGAIGQLARVREPELLADLGVVPGAVHLARLHGHDRRAGAGSLGSDLVRPELGLVVPAEEALAEVPSVRLVDRLAVGVAEHADGRDVDDARRSCRLRGVEHAGRRPDVRVPHGAPLGAGDPHAVAAGRVDRGIDVTQRLGGDGDVREVVLEHRDAHVDEVAGLPRVAHRGDDLVATGSEDADHRLADEAGRAGDPDATGSGLLSCGWGLPGRPGHWLAGRRWFRGAFRCWWLRARGRRGRAPRGSLRRGLRLRVGHGSASPRRGRSVDRRL